jgi:chromosome segregation ATPase
MTSLLTNEDKLNILNQHIRNLEFAIYGLELDIIEYAASVEKDTDYSSKLNSRLTELQAKKALLDSEKEDLTAGA